MYWLLCASTGWKTMLSSANRVKLTDPPVPPGALAEADGGALGEAVAGAALAEAGAELAGAAVGAAVVGAAVAGAAVGAGVAADEHAPRIRANVAPMLSHFLSINEPPPSARQRQARRPASVAATRVPAGPGPTPSPGEQGPGAAMRAAADATIPSGGSQFFDFGRQAACRRPAGRARTRG